MAIACAEIQEGGGIRVFTRRFAFEENSVICQLN
jgi:hypothetical protein